MKSALQALALALLLAELLGDVSSGQDSGFTNAIEQINRSTNRTVLERLILTRGLPRDLPGLDERSVYREVWDSLTPMVRFHKVLQSIDPGLEVTYATNEDGTVACRVHCSNLEERRRVQNGLVATFYCCNGTVDPPTVDVQLPATWSTAALSEEQRIALVTYIKGKLAETMKKWKADLDGQHGQEAQKHQDLMRQFLEEGQEQVRLFEQAHSSTNSEPAAANQKSALKPVSHSPGSGGGTVIPARITQPAAATDRGQ
jgi:hypothetical protein